MELEAVIGLEIHAQLKTATKLFCRCAVSGSYASPNSHICPVCTGQPGALPAANQKAVELAAKTGAALNCRVNERSVFARKNYFYPDLPKGYQISQFENPLCENGFLILSGGGKIRIKRAHLEEDAGKSLHAIGSRRLDHTLVDFNRCGLPLVEIVSEPDLSSPEEAHEFLVELKKILRWIDVSNCDMEKGELRCDVNVSIRKTGESGLGKKVEIKNLNSFKAVKDAINHELKRQKELLLKGGNVARDTRLWDEKEQRTVPMRSKETAHDYRYFPDPDLPPVDLSRERIEEITRSTGKLPAEFKKEYMEKYSLTGKEAEILTSGKHLNDYFSKILAPNPDKKTVKTAVNLINGQLLARMNEFKIAEEEITTRCIKPEYLLELASLISAGSVSASAAKKVFDACWDNSLAPKAALKKLGLKQTSDAVEIEAWAREAAALNKKAFEDLKNGNEKAAGPMIAFIMKKSGGQANPGTANEILKKIASER